MWASVQPFMAKARRPKSTRREKAECPFSPAPIALNSSLKWLPADVVAVAAAAAEAMVVGGAARRAANKSAVAVTTAGTEACCRSAPKPEAATRAHAAGEPYKLRHASTKAPASSATTNGGAAAATVAPPPAEEGARGGWKAEGSARRRSSSNIARRVRFCEQLCHKGKGCAHRVKIQLKQFTQNYKCNKNTVRAHACSAKKRALGTAPSSPCAKGSPGAPAAAADVSTSGTPRARLATTLKFTGRKEETI